jgi:hypothetical protein
MVIVLRALAVSQNDSGVIKLLQLLPGGALTGTRMPLGREPLEPMDALDQVIRKTGRGIVPEITKCLLAPLGETAVLKDVAGIVRI